MNKSEIGKLIHYERTKEKINLQKLASGICSVTALQRAGKCIQQGSVAVWHDNHGAGL